MIVSVKKNADIVIKRISILLVISVAVIAQVFSQSVEFDFPKLNGDTAWIYIFAGSKVDSINIVLDGKGKYPPQTPRRGGVVPALEGYRGMAYLYIPEKGVGEFILAEKNLRITCAEEHFNAMTLEFPNSEENDFMRWSFQWQNHLLTQKAAMDEFDKIDKENKGEASYELTFLRSYALQMSEINEKAIQHLNNVIATSPLYAARFLELMLFMQRLYASIQTADSVERRILRYEMENTLDINALYHAGNLWTDIHSWYPGLFIDNDGKPIEEAYVASISMTLRRLEEPALTAFLSEALVACERANLQSAQEALLTDFIMTYPTMQISDVKVQRMLGALSLNKGAQAPQIIGLEKPLSQAAILIFFDSNCDHCQNEIDRLTQHYKEITDKGYRIISIAADTHENNYRNYATTLPWDKTDRLCDFNGTRGANFKNYGVIGMPTLFVIDENNTIIGKFAQTKEIENLIK